MPRDTEAHDPKPLDPRRVRRALFGAAGAAALIVAAGLALRAHQAHSAARWSVAQATPTVALAVLDRQAQGALLLPGEVQPFQIAHIYARVNGYLKDWRRDIGAPVRSGEVLADIDAPDLDQQLQQARGDLATAQANAKLSSLTATRWSALLEHQAVSQQASDEKAGAAQATAAAATAASANVARLQALAAYEQVRAPFGGVVTVRKTDVGALISATGAGQELFEVADLHRVRIYVQAPQALSARLAPGQSATFEAPQYPGRTFTAQIVALSHQFDPNSKTMLVELQADNPGELLAAGSYCQVRFVFPSDPGLVQVPATALIAQADGPRLAVVGADGRVRLQPVKLGRDLGDKVEVISGVQTTDRVIDSPPETLRDGDTVTLAKAAPAPTTGGRA
jgi:RND family efflux transporter MFP subunit